jgi:hypothetical protein
MVTVGARLAYWHPAVSKLARSAGRSRQPTWLFTGASNLALATRSASASEPDSGHSSASD